MKDTPVERQLEEARKIIGAVYKSFGALQPDGYYHLVATSEFVDAIAAMTPHATTIEGGRE